MVTLHMVKTKQVSRKSLFGVNQSHVIDDKYMIIILNMSLNVLIS